VKRVLIFLAGTEAELVPCHHRSILLQSLQLKQGQTASYGNQLGYLPVPEEGKGAQKDGLVVKGLVKDIRVFPGKLAGVLLSFLSRSPTSVERG